MNPFRCLRDYEFFVYTLQADYPAIAHSTLVLQQRGRLFAELNGELFFRNGCRLVVYERIAWERAELRIVGYSYEAWRGSDKLYWYDSQPHASDSALAPTLPHHKHIPPDIKHHRVPAPEMSLTQPNMPVLIGEICQRL